MFAFAGVDLTHAGKKLARKVRRNHNFATRAPIKNEAPGAKWLMSGLRPPDPWSGLRTISEYIIIRLRGARTCAGMETGQKQPVYAPFHRSGQSGYGSMRHQCR